MSNAEITQTECYALVAALRALKIDAVTRVSESCPKNADGSYTGEIVKTLSVHAVLVDAAHGNTIVRTVREPADAAKIATDMRAEMKTAAKAVRARIRAERAPS